ARQSILRVRALEETGEGPLRPVEAGGEAQRLFDGRMTPREGLRTGGAALEVGGDAQRFAGRGSSPVTSRYQPGWCSRAHARVTVPRVIEPNVPGSAAVPR